MAKKKAPLRKPASSGSGIGKQWRDALRLELARADGPTGTALERIARIVVHDALNGDYVAIQEIANRIDGKVAVQENAGSDEPVQKLIVTWEGPAPAVDRAPHTKIIEHHPAPAERGMHHSEVPPERRMPDSEVPVADPEVLK